MADFPFELPSVTPFENISEYIPLIVTAIDIALNNSYSWADPVDGQEKMEDLISWIILNLPCAAMREVGEIITLANATTPSGFLPCDGAAVSRTTYAALFSAIGITFGAGNGTTTFNVPDLRGRVPIGVGQGTGLTNRTLAEQVGVENQSLTTANLPAHNHNLDNSAGVDIKRTGGSGSSGETLLTTFNASLANVRLTTENAGSGTAHNNVQPSLVLAYFIYSG